MTLEELNQLAEQGFITDVTLIETCTKNPELLKTIDFGQFVSQITSPMDVEEVKESLIDMLAKGGIIKLTSDILIDDATMLNITNEVVLDLNGHQITKTGITESNKCVLFYVKGEGSKLTIKGEGGVNVESGGDVDIAVWADEGSEVVIESGDFHGVSCSDLIYSINGGKITVKGGSFKQDNINETAFAKPQYPLLNVYKGTVANAQDFITVSGGKFYEFDPANNVSEGKGTNFVIEGYESVKDDDGWFTVQEVVVKDPVEETTEPKVVEPEVIEVSQVLKQPEQEIVVEEQE